MDYTLYIAILTHNNEDEIINLLKSIKNFRNYKVICVDDFSTDKTLQILKSHKIQVYQNKFENYAKQRSIINDYIPNNSWILHLDSDEICSEKLIQEIEKHIKTTEMPLLIKKVCYYHKKEVRHGSLNPNWQLRLFKKGDATTEQRQYDQHFITHLDYKLAKSTIIEIENHSFIKLLTKHLVWSKREAQDLLQSNITDLPSAVDIRNKKRKYKMIYYKLPYFLRVLLFFFYEILIKKIYLDHPKVYPYHIIRSFFFRLFVDYFICAIRLSKFCRTRL